MRATTIPSDAIALTNNTSDIEPKQCTTSAKWLWALPIAASIFVAHAIASFSVMAAVAGSSLCDAPQMQLHLSVAQRAAVVTSLRRCSDGMDLTGVLIGCLVAIPFVWPIARIYGKQSFLASMLLGMAPVAYWFGSAGGLIDEYTWPLQTGAVLMLLTLSVGSTLVWTLRCCAAARRASSPGPR